MKASNGLAFELTATSSSGLLRIDRWLKKL